MSRVLVTSGSGFIAGWCIVQPIKDGHEVVATIRSRVELAINKLTRGHRRDAVP